MIHKEFGQTYNEYINIDYVPVDPNHNTIYILRLYNSSNNEDSIKDDFFQYIVSLLEAFFSGMKISPIEGNNFINTNENNNENNKGNNNENNNENNPENNNEIIMKMKIIMR